VSHQVATQGGELTRDLPIPSGRSIGKTARAGSSWKRGDDGSDPGYRKDLVASVVHRRNTDLLCESRSSRYSRCKLLTPDEFYGLETAECVGMLSYGIVLVAHRKSTGHLIVGVRGLCGK
jgi:hypothetical protein